MNETQLNKDTLIMVTRQGMGSADTELQSKLFQTYLRLLDENDMLPGAICFYGEGVKTLAEDSPAITHLKSLEAKGVHLILCNTCLQYYNLAEEVRVGIVGGMTDIIAAQWAAKKVITI